MFLVITNSKHVLYRFCSGCIHLNTPCLWSFSLPPPPFPCKRSSLYIQFHCVVFMFIGGFYVSVNPFGGFVLWKIGGGGGKRLLVVPCPKPKGLLMQYIYYMH